MFNYKKATQVLSFFAARAEKEGIPLYKTNMLKLVYFADKKHICDYLRTITGDLYQAKQMGPVAKNTVELIESCSNDDENRAEQVKYAREFIAVTAFPNTPSKDGNRPRMKIESVRETDMKQLSETDREVLDFVWNIFRKDLKQPESRGVFWEKTHIYPEGAKFEKSEKWEDIDEEELLSAATGNNKDILGVCDLKTARDLYIEHKQAEKILEAARI